MKAVRPAGRMAMLLSMACLSAITAVAPMTAARAQTRVDRTLSVSPPAQSGLPATVNTITTPATPALPPAASNTEVPVTGHRPAGAYSSDAMGPAIVAKNADYETTFRINAPVPPGSTITRVSWRYGVSQKPVGFEAVLCWSDRQPCWNVTNQASGSTVAFNGKDAAQAFTLHYRVTGGGLLGAPALGAMNQIIVSYDLPG